MDQIKTGKFIADERKKKGYTQRQLAEQLGISDKTISKWERGNGFPEISLLLPLCNELDLSVNELLTGERISETEYREKAEENMVNLVKEAQESKKKIILSGMVSALVIIAATPMFVVAGAFPMEDWMRIALIADGRLCHGSAHADQKKAGMPALRGAPVLQKGVDEIKNISENIGRNPKKVRL